MTGKAALKRQRQGEEWRAALEEARAFGLEAGFTPDRVNLHLRAIPEFDLTALCQLTVFYGHAIARRKHAEDVCSEK